MKPFCFVLMPFGKMKNESGRLIDFDRVYANVIKPAFDAVDLEPIRADGETEGGSIHKPMFERLMLCDYAVADLTTANANVFYELGIRHGIQPNTTVLIFGKGLRRWSCRGESLANFEAPGSPMAESVREALREIELPGSRLK